MPVPEKAPEGGTCETKVKEKGSSSLARGFQAQAIKKQPGTRRLITPPTSPTGLHLKAPLLRLMGFPSGGQLDAPMNINWMLP